MSEWIDADIQKPESYVDVLITNGVEVGIGWWDGHCYCWQFNLRANWWMPLPQPPKGEPT